MLRREFLVKGTAVGIAAPFVSTKLAWGQSGSLERINIVSTSGTTNLVLTALLNEMGYFKELGLSPNYVNVANGNQVVASLISGEMDICPTSGFTQVLAAIERGATLKIIAGGAVKNFNALFTGRPDLKTLKDLEGRTVGVGALGTQLHQSMVALFKKYGVDISKVTFANVGSGVDVFKAVKARVVDAGPSEVWLGVGTDLRILENGKTFESLTEFVNQAAFTSDKAIKEKRGLIVKTLAAYAKLYRFIMSGDSEKAFISASAKALSKNDPDAARTQWKFYREIQPFAGDLVLGEDRIKYMQELNVTTATQKQILPYDKVADMSLARDALKLLA